MFTFIQFGSRDHEEKLSTNKFTRNHPDSVAKDLQTSTGELVSNLKSNLTAPHFRSPS